MPTLDQTGLGWSPRSAPTNCVPLGMLPHLSQPQHSHLYHRIKLNNSSSTHPGTKSIHIHFLSSSLLHLLQENSALYLCPPASRSSKSRVWRLLDLSSPPIWASAPPQSSNSPSADHQATERVAERHSRSYMWLPRRGGRVRRGWMT